MSDPNGTIQRATVGASAHVPFIRTLAEAAEAFGDPAGWPPEMREATREVFERPDPLNGAPLYLSADGYTLLARDGRGVFHSVGVVTERTPDGFVARLHGDLKSVSITGKIVS